MDDESRVAKLAMRWLRNLVLLAAILGFHGWQTLQLFGEYPWSDLTNREPIVEGRHAVHLYHARLAASNWRETGSPCSYDVANAAGYPRTAIVDAGSRPFEIFLLASQADPATAYKTGLALVWWLLPLAYWGAARSLGLRTFPAATAAGLVVLLAGSNDGQKLIHEGDLNAAIVATLAVVQMVLLTRWHSRPCLTGWFSMLLIAALGWFLQPIAWLGFSILGVGCWLNMSRRHDLWWSLTLVILQSIAFVASFPWLREWVRFWWIALPVPVHLDGLSKENWLENISNLWPSSDRLAFWGLILLGCCGGVIRKPRQDRRPSLYLVAAGLALLIFAVVSMFWSPLALLGARHWATVGLAFLIVPAAQAIDAGKVWLFRGLGRPFRSLAAAAVIIYLAAYFLIQPTAPSTSPGWGARPLNVGIPESTRSAIDFIRDRTASTARVLWEAPEIWEQAPWLILLPTLLDRHCLIPLDSNSDVEHSFAHLTAGQLAGRPIEDWTDAQLESFCRKYNVGAVVSSTTKSKRRLQSWSPAREVHLPETDDRLFVISRPHSYILKGQARIEEATHRKICLTDVVPENGEIVLSFHAVPGLFARPGWIEVEREPDPYDPIPFVRLRIAAPTPRITLTWREP